jgi:hypothetical protein
MQENTYDIKKKMKKVQELDTDEDRSSSDASQHEVYQEEDFKLEEEKSPIEGSFRNFSD